MPKRPPPEIIDQFVSIFREARDDIHAKLIDEAWFGRQESARSEDRDVSPRTEPNCEPVQPTLADLWRDNPLTHDGRLADYHQAAWGEQKSCLDGPIQPGVEQPEIER